MITRDDIERKAQEIEEALGETGSLARSSATRATTRLVAGAVGAYLMGRWRAKRKGVRVEIHRL